ncbi:AAA family ATPase [Actinocorallia populi]|uniref:AAA family ATPase n=1 Tax=Actinocorallia populi TaxID=2079200 RepID=UPI000D08910F|nr:AAA family ATPase [Actinocorallia populi]
MPVICEPDDSAARRLAAGFREHAHVVRALRAVDERLAADREELVVVIGPNVELAGAIAFAAARRADRPEVGVVLVRDRVDVGVMAEAMRAGVREVVPDRDFQALMDACRRCWEVSRGIQRTGRPEAPPSPGRDGRIVVMFAAKGGCGKTVLATNLGVALAGRDGLEVCLVDLDLAFGDVAITLRLSPQRTIVHAVPMAGRMDETGVQSLLVRHESGLATVLAPVSPGESEQISGPLVTELLGMLKRSFDIVVVDTPSQLSEHVLAAMDVADRHLLPVVPEVTALKGLRVTLDMLDLLGYPPGARSFLLNRADIKAGLSVADIEKVIGARATVLLPHSQDVPASVNRGVPLVQQDPGHAFSQAVGRVALAVTEGNEAVRDPAGRGFFRRSRASRG